MVDLNNLIPPKIFEITVWNTSRCNLKCKYCFNYALYDVQSQDMDRDTAQALINFAKLHLDPNGSLWFFGGEPLVNQDNITYIVDTAIANKVCHRFGMTTNATLLTEDFVDWMKKRNFGILISIDGDKEIHDKFRVFADGRGSWEYVWKSIQLVRKKLTPNPQIRWTVPLDPEIMEKTPKAYKWFLEQGLTSIALDFVYESDIDTDLLDAAKKMMNEIADILDPLYQRGVKVFNMMARDTYQTMSSHSRIPWHSRCGLAQGTIGVTPKGDIVPCHRYVASNAFKVGDVFEGFTNERVKLIESWIKYPPYSEEPDLCLRCPYKNACTGGCLAMNYDLFGDIHVVPKTFCLLKWETVRSFHNLVAKHFELCREIYSYAGGF